MSEEKKAPTPGELLELAEVKAVGETLLTLTASIARNPAVGMGALTYATVKLVVENAKTYEGAEKLIAQTGDLYARALPPMWRAFQASGGRGDAEQPSSPPTEKPHEPETAAFKS